MKKILKIAVVVIAIGAAIQTIVSVATAEPKVAAKGEPGI